jgi:hypothetical protein
MECSKKEENQKVKQDKEDCVLLCKDRIPLVCPSSRNPVSNSPSAALTTKIAISAYRRSMNC